MSDHIKDAAEKLGIETSPLNIEQHLPVQEIRIIPEGILVVYGPEKAD